MPAGTGHEDGDDRLDAVVLGGGVAGLWTLHALRHHGYDAMLLASPSLGAGQTIASQGIIHGGVKYALTGSASRASRLIAPMPGRWASCLRGEAHDGPDLRSARILAEGQCLWTTRGVGSRLSALAASKAIRTDVRRLPDSERPRALAPDAGAAGIDVYDVAEPVLDPRSLVQALADASPGAVRTIHEVGDVALSAEPGGVAVRIAGVSRPIRARIAALCAGAGNEALLASVSAGAATTPRMQRRPLHMVMLRAAPTDLPPLYAHCVGVGPRPRVTVTTQADAHGRTVWYVGGEIAESGVTRDRESQIAAARAELADVLPWLARAGAFDRADWATLRIDRAEALTPGGVRPDEPMVLAAGPVIAVWPTKLAFAPAAASEVIRLVRAVLPRPAGAPRAHHAPPPDIARLPWDEESLQWT